MARFWIPAFAGMTGACSFCHSGENRNPGGLPLIIEKILRIAIRKRFLFQYRRFGRDLDRLNRGLKKIGCCDVEKFNVRIKVMRELATAMRGENWNVTESVIRKKICK